MATTIIEIKPHRGGWQCYEAPGVAPYWTGADAKQSATDYATQRMKARGGEIRIVNGTGEVESTLGFEKSGAQINCGSTQIESRVPD